MVTHLSDTQKKRLLKWGEQHKNAEPIPLAEDSELDYNDRSQTRLQKIFLLDLNKKDGKL